MEPTRQQVEIDLAIDAVMECSIQHYDAMASLVAETGEGRGHPTVIRAYNQLVAAHADYIEALNAVAPKVVERHSGKLPATKKRGFKSITKQGKAIAAAMRVTRPSRAKKVLDSASLNPVDCGEFWG